MVIKNIAREAVARSKVAVFSNQQGIDPVGSCVGQRGVRVQAIIQEFNGLEKIDIIQWHDNAKDYIAQALSPAKNVRVELDKKGEKTAHVFVPVEELSLAIGRDGQNVRLASKLTGYTIEIEEDKTIKKTEEPEKTKEEKTIVSTEGSSEPKEEKKEEKTKKPKTEKKKAAKIEEKVKEPKKEQEEEVKAEEKEEPKVEVPEDTKV